MSDHFNFQFIGIAITVFYVGILFIIFCYLIYFGPNWYDRSADTPWPTDFLRSTSIFNNAPDFCFAFHFQIYFLIVSQYLGHKQKVKNSYIVGTAVNGLVLVFIIVYTTLCLSTNIVFGDFREAIYDKFEVPGNKILANIILLCITML